jgi:uncharacterized membrane protein YgcG
VAQVAAGDESAVSLRTEAQAAPLSRPGAGLAPRVQERVEHNLQKVRQDNGLDLSVLVGDLDLTDVGDFRSGAELLHAALGPRADHAVLVVVAPGQRKVEIVTGAGARHRVPDRVCGLAILSMTTSFANGDLGGGIIDAIRQIASSAGEGSALPAIAEPAGAADHHAPALHGH